MSSMCFGSHCVLSVPRLNSSHVLQNRFYHSVPLIVLLHSSHFLFCSRRLSVISQVVSKVDLSGTRQEEYVAAIKFRLLNVGVALLDIHSVNESGYLGFCCSGIPITRRYLRLCTRPFPCSTVLLAPDMKDEVLCKHSHIYSFLLAR